MLVKFKGPRKIGSKLYDKGTHEVPHEHADHWFFKGLLKQGDVSIIEEVKVASPPTVEPTKPEVLVEPVVAPPVQPEAPVKPAMVVQPKGQASQSQKKKA